MESLFSLFGPSEGQTRKKKSNPDSIPDNVKKRVDPPKGRRRGRKHPNRQDSLPEESSFLCEPETSSDLLMRDGGYMDAHFHRLAPPPDTKPDQKPKRRDSLRRPRRRRSKVSPCKELMSSVAWGEDPPCGQELLNNRAGSVVPQRPLQCVGKNVNNLRETDDELDYLKTCRRKGDGCIDGGSFEERQVYKVIDSLERVSLKHDEYTRGDLSPEDIAGGTSDSCSDGGDSEDDSSLDEDVCAVGEGGGEGGEPPAAPLRLPPEPRFGNVEYKLQLISVTEHRLQHLVTQLKWRLRSGGGSAIYVVGVRDCGAVRGLRPRALRASLRTLRRMAAALGASLQHVTARRVAQHRAVAEVYIRKLAEPQQSELRVAVTGANDAGKSTLIGVLTQGELDNGRGSARLNMFRHVHEVRSGRTSSLSHEILGFDVQGNVVNYGCSELMTAERIGERSAKLVSFLDLAGHSKYQRTTVHGLTGYSPHYCMLVVSATAGITQVTEEHLALLSALDLPFFIVVTKVELAPADQLDNITAYIRDRSGRRSAVITDENLARNCVAGPQQLILDSVLKQSADIEEKTLSDVIPVFPVSCVKGTGLNALHAYLLALQPPHRDAPPNDANEQESCEFQIDEIFHVGESSGPVVGGLLAAGTVREGDSLLIGPLDSGDFVEISVRSIYRNRVPCACVRAGQSASLGLSRYPPNLRQGMVLLTIPPSYTRGERRARLSFGACPPGRCKSTKRAPATARPARSKRDKNLLKDLELVETSLMKSTSTSFGGSNNVYSEEGEVGGGGGECCCEDRVLLEDPSDPRGCLYFQASLLLLRHGTRHISVGFQCTAHIGNVRQTAVIEGIMTGTGVLGIGCRASVLFRFARWPEYVRPDRTVLCRAGPGTRAVGTLTQVFPHYARTD